MNAPDRDIEFHCQECRLPLSSPAGSRDRFVTCPECETRTEIPRYELIATKADEARPATPDSSESAAAGPAGSASTQQPPPGGSAVTARPGEVAEARPVFTGPPPDPPIRKQIASWLFRTLLDSRMGLVSLVVMLVGSGLVVWLVWQHRDDARNRQLLQARWNEADSLFRQAQFDSALSRYEAVEEAARNWGRQGKRHLELARDMLATCRPAAAVTRALDDQATDPTESLEQLRKAGRQLAGEQALKPANGGQAAPASDEDPPSGLEFSRIDRWHEIVDQWLIKRAARLADALEQQAGPGTPQINQLQQLARFIGSLGRNTDSFEKCCHLARETARFSKLRSEFEAAATQATRDYSLDAVRQTHQLWRQLNEQFGERIDRSAWADHLGQLQSGLLARAGRSIESDPDAVGTIDTRGPEVLSLQEFAAPSTGDGDEQGTGDGGLVYARDADRLLALDARTGIPRWVIRQGTDARWFPAGTDAANPERVIITWHDDDGTHVTLARSPDAAPAWTWHLPTGCELVGAPLVVGESLLVLLEDGRLWQLDLATGQPLARLELPEPVSVPPVINRASGTIACLGRFMAVYTLETTPRLAVDSVTVRDDISDAGDAFPVWVNPYLLLFVNQVDGSCGLTVFRESPTGLHRVQQSTFPGKLWQRPPVVGHSVLVTTDSGYRGFLALQPEEAEQPLVRVWESSTSEPTAAVRPFLLSHAEAPCLLAHRDRLESLSFDPVAADESAGPQVAWTHRFGDPDFIVDQPLQSSAYGIVVTGRRPGRRGIEVHCVDATSGERRWSRRLGPADSEPTSPKPDRPMSSLPQADLGFVVQQAPDAGGTLHVGHPGPVDALDPWNANRPLERELAALLFDRLFELDPRGNRYTKGSLVAGYELTDGFRQSKNGLACLEFRIRLHRGSRFADGTPITSADIIASIQRLAESATSWHHREQSRYLRETAVESDDRLSILIRPHLVPQSLFTFCVIPSRQFSTVPPRRTRLSQLPLGSGRYVPGEREQAGTIRLRSNTHWNRSEREPAIREIVLHRYSPGELEQAGRDLRAQRLDMIAGLGPAELARVAGSRPPGTVWTLPVHTVSILAINHRRPAFRSATNRRMLAQALDRSALLAATLPRLPAGVARPELVSGPFPPGPFENPGVVRTAPDEVVARARIAELRKEIGGSFELKYCGEDAWMTRVANRIVDRLNQLGLPISGRPLSWELMERDVVRNQSYDLALWQLAHRDAVMNIGGLFSPGRSSASSGGGNLFGYQKQDVLQALVDVREAVTGRQLREAQRDVHQFLHDDTVFVPLWTLPSYAIVGPRLGQVAPPVNRAGSQVPWTWLFQGIENWTLNRAEAPND